VEITQVNGARHVLIVDDEKVIAITLGRIFSGIGYEVRTAYSAEEALTLMNGWTPELAVLDVSLPGMNGVDLAIHLRGLRPECRVLLISGKPDTQEVMERACRNGHELELMAKPVPPRILLDRAAELLA
jgi:DNA-binding response OmpR family regulator